MLAKCSPLFRQKVAEMLELKIVFPGGTIRDTYPYDQPPRNPNQTARLKAGETVCTETVLLAEEVCRRVH